MAQFNKINFEQDELDNGLIVLYHSDKSTPVVSVVTHYKVGSSYEGRNQKGFAHFFEHLMFSGTENIPDGKIEEYIQSAGGNFNAHTSFEETVYKITLPSHQLPLALWIESERMQNLKINKENVEKEKKIVIEEKKMSVDNAPYGTSVPNILKTMFENTPYESHVIGDEDDIRKADVEDFLEFYNNYYHPNNAVISISGDFEIDTARKYINEYFSQIQGREIPEKEDFKVDFIEKEVINEYKDKFADVPAVFLAYYAPSIKNENYAYDILLNILSDGESSRLYKRFVSQDEKALVIFAQPLLFYDNGLAMFMAIPNENTEPKELVKMLDEELAKIIEQGITDNELEKAINTIESQFVSSKYMSMHNALLLAKYTAYYDNPDKINDDLKKYLNVSKNDVIKTAKDIFDTNSRVILYYYPDILK